MDSDYVRKWTNRLKNIKYSHKIIPFVFKLKTHFLLSSTSLMSCWIKLNFYWVLCEVNEMVFIIFFPFIKLNFYLNEHKDWIHFENECEERHTMERKNKNQINITTLVLLWQKCRQIFDGFIKNAELKLKKKKKGFSIKNVCRITGKSVIGQNKKQKMFSQCSNISLEWRSICIFFHKQFCMVFLETKSKSADIYHELKLIKIQLEHDEMSKEMENIFRIVIECDRRSIKWIKRTWAKCLW